jgi:hypothetical protein
MGVDIDVDVARREKDNYRTNAPKSKKLDKN